MTKDPWLFWRGGVEVERRIFGKSWVCPAWTNNGCFVIGSSN